MFSAFWYARQAIAFRVSVGAICKILNQNQSHSLPQLIRIDISLLLYLIPLVEAT